MPTITSNTVVTELLTKAVDILSKLPTIIDDDLDRCFARLRSISFDHINNIHPFRHGTENNVLSVEPVGLDGAQKEL